MDAMQSFMPAFLIGTIVTLSGCHSGLFAKRQSEANCPTDIRQTVPWCAGEDAIFRCPCRPAQAYYGHKPTCWRVWPTSGAEWRDANCCLEPGMEYFGSEVPVESQDSLRDKLEGPTVKPPEPLPVPTASRPVGPAEASLFSPPQPNPFR